MKISLIGAGNMGYHLATQFSAAGADLACVFSRNIADAESITRRTGGVAVDSFHSIVTNVDLVVIAVSDSAIRDVVQQLGTIADRSDCTVVHTAGSVTSGVLNIFNNHGVLYPLQTLTRGRAIDWQSVPVLVTGNNLQALGNIHRAARHLSPAVHEITDRERLVLHLGATMANNFSNHMFALAQRSLEQYGLDFDLLRPLILETALKVQELNPGDAQTGPAVRGDFETMARHLELIADDPTLAKLYRDISESIRLTGGPPQ